MCSMFHDDTAMRLARFHVDKMSSAHVYLRMNKVLHNLRSSLYEVTHYSHANHMLFSCWSHVDHILTSCWLLLQGMTIDAIPDALLVDCVQLVKANSIQGVCLFVCVYSTSVCVCVCCVYVCVRAFMCCGMCACVYVYMCLFECVYVFASVLQCHVWPDKC